jgi:hypothetical protein
MTQRKSVAAHVAEVIAYNRDELLAATRHGALYAIAKENGLDTAQRFSAFKVALKTELNIDYDAMRASYQDAYAQTPQGKQDAIYSVLSRAADRAEMINQTPASEKQMALLARLAVQKFNGDIEAVTDGHNISHTHFVLTSKKASALISQALGA